MLTDSFLHAKEYIVSIEHVLSTPQLKCKLLFAFWAATNPVTVCPEKKSADMNRHREMVLKYTEEKQW